MSSLADVTMSLTTAPYLSMSGGLVMAPRFQRNIFNFLGCSLGNSRCFRMSRGTRVCDGMGKNRGSHSTSVLGTSALQKSWSVFKQHCSRNKLWQAEEPIPISPQCVPAASLQRLVHRVKKRAFPFEWGQGMGIFRWHSAEACCHYKDSMTFYLANIY